VKEALKKGGDDPNFPLTRDSRKKEEIQEGATQEFLVGKEETVLELIHGKRVLCSDIKSDFNHMDLSKLISLATKNQVVYRVEVGSVIDLTQTKEIQKYIEDKGENYNQVEEIVFLAQGGESYVLRLKVKQPVEVIAKMILPSKESN
jgi:hypothetical protein